jgi:hypothetical protein
MNLFALTIDPSAGDVIDRVIVSASNGVAVQDISGQSGSAFALMPRSSGYDSLVGALFTVQTADGLDVYCAARKAIRRVHIPLK